jgi:cytochrome o ubiquinol oxidase subunit II
MDRKLGGKLLQENALKHGQQHAGVRVGMEPERRKPALSHGGEYRRPNRRVSCDEKETAMRADADGPHDQTRRSGSVGMWATRGAAILMPAVLTGCQTAILDPKGPVGLANRTILVDSLVIMLAIVVPTIVVTLCVAWWFRASNTKAHYMPNFVYSGRIELVTWSIPLLTIVLLGGVAWIGSHELDPAKPLDSKTPALEVQGISLDWKWLFIYPQQRLATVNQLVVPAGVPLHFTLTSASVMNVFFVPQLGSMIYTMNGMATQLYLQADQPGTYSGRSAHFSGDGFPGMYFDVRAVTPEQFDSWTAATHSNGPVLDSGSYGDLAKQTMNVNPFTYRDADPTLFQKVVTQRLAPGPGRRS